MKSTIICFTFFFLSHLALAQEDQSLQWFSYFGGTGLEFVESVESTSQNEIVIAGTTESSFGMATSGAYQTEKNGGLNDAYISRWTGSGELIWSTYYGGEGSESLKDVVVLNDGSIIAVGYTDSENNIATPGSYQPSKLAPQAGFIAKFDSDGQMLWATYLSGIGGDFISGVCKADSGGVIVTGLTQSPGMATANAFQTEKAGLVDGFIAKYSENGQQLWYTYFGGEEFDEIYTAEADSGNNIVFIGYTNGSEGLASPDASQETGTGKSLILGKLDINGDRIWSTYISGNEDERYADLTMGSDNEIILTARTSSTAGISTPESYQTENSSGTNTQFIAKYSAQGEKLWATYLGEFDLTYGYGDINYSNASIYFSGMGTSESQPLVIGDNPFQPQNNGANTNTENRFDAILVKLTENGYPEWGTFFGGDQNEVSNLIAPLGEGGNFVIGGMTYSPDFYSSEASWQENISGGSDYYLAMFSDETITSQTEIKNPRPDVRIYPNPSKQNIRIDWNTEYGRKSEIRILNTIGKTVYRNPNYRPNTILATNLRSGLYMILIHQEGQTISRKLIIE